MKKVLITIPTNNEVMPEVMKAVNAQTYPNFDVLVNVGDSPLDPKLETLLKTFAISRNKIRELALETDAEYIFMVDSDVLVPVDALANLMYQMGNKVTSIDWRAPDGRIIPKGTKNPEKFIIGGWYPKKFTNNHEWICGKWTADNLFMTLNYPAKSLIEVDMVGLGCCLVKRELLEKVKWVESELFKISKDRWGEDTYAGDCLAFCNLVADAGYRMYMDGSVICKHLIRSRKEEAIA